MPMKFPTNIVVTISDPIRKKFSIQLEEKKKERRKGQWVSVWATEINIQRLKSNIKRE